MSRLQLRHSLYIQHHGCIIQSVKINLPQRNNSSIDSADFAKGCPHFCSEMVPFNGAHSANTSSPWYYSVLLAHLSVCFCSSHHLCLSPLCCICEIQTLNTNIWEWKHSGSTALSQKKICERFTAGFRSQLCWREDVALWFASTLGKWTMTTAIK